MNTLISAVTALPAVTALADDVNSTGFDISTLINSMATSVSNNIGVVMTAVAPIIATVVGINFAVRMFKRYGKG